MRFSLFILKNPHVCALERGGKKGAVERLKKQSMCGERVCN